MGSPSPDACDPYLHLRYQDVQHNIYYASQNVGGGTEGSGSCAFSHNKENSDYNNNNNSNENNEDDDFEEEECIGRKSDSLSKFSVYLDEIARLRKDLQGAQALAEHRLQMIFELQDAVAAKADGPAPAAAGAETTAETAAEPLPSHPAEEIPPPPSAPAAVRRHVDPCEHTLETRATSSSAARARRLAPSLTRLAPPAPPLGSGCDAACKKEATRSGSSVTEASATRLSGSGRAKEAPAVKHAPLLLSRGKPAAPAAAGATATGTKSALKLLPRAAVKRVPEVAPAPAAPSPPSAAAATAAGPPSASEPRARSTASAARSIKERAQLGKKRLPARTSADPKKKSDPRDDGSSGGAKTPTRDPNEAEGKGGAGTPLLRKIKKRTTSAQSLHSARDGVQVTLRSGQRTAATRTPSGCSFSTPTKAPPPTAAARTRSASDGGAKHPRVASKGAHKREALRPVTNTLAQTQSRSSRTADAATPMTTTMSSSSSSAHNATCASARLHTLQERYENAQVSLAMLRGLVLRGDSTLLRVLSRCSNCSAARAGSLLAVALATLRQTLVGAQPDRFAPKMAEGSVWQLSSEDLRLLEVAPLPGAAMALREVVVAHDWLRWTNRALLGGRAGRSTRGSSSGSNSAELVLSESLEMTLFEIYVNLHVLLTVAQSLSVVKQLSS